MRWMIFLGIFLISFSLTGGEFNIIDFNKNKPSGKTLFESTMEKKSEVIGEICQGMLSPAPIKRSFETHEKTRKLILIESVGEGVNKALNGFIISVINPNYIYLAYMCSRKGGGRALMETFLKYLKSSTYPKKVKLTSDYRVEGFYLKMGFKDMGDGDFEKEIK